MATASLPDLLAENGITPKSYRSAHTEKLRCPKCEGGRTRELSLSLTIDEDGNGATWICHRGTCGWQSGARLHRDRDDERPRAAAPRAIQAAPMHATEIQANRPDELYQFFASRRIGAKTVDAFGCYVADRWYSEEIGKAPSIVFPFALGGKVVNRKYRALRDKTWQRQETDALATLFNVDTLGDAPSEVVWVEGEPDVMALHECGVRNAVSLKDGAPKEATFREDDKRFEALRTHGDLLAKVKRFILAGDMDGPGLALREELARRLGRHRCWLVTWPEGRKDAGDTLREDGPDTVIDCLTAAQPYPIEGLQRIRIGTLSSLLAKPAPSVLSTGTRASDSVLKLPAEGRLVVVTGFPSHGKTSWTRFVMVHTASDHHRKWAVFSPEHQPWEHFAAQCAEVFSGKPFYPVRGLESMTEADVLDAEVWLSNRVTMIVCDAEEVAPTLEWLIERARAAVLRDGVTDLLIDPWNEIAHDRGNMSETDYIGRALQQLKAFGLRHGCNVWIVGHPVKPMPLKPGEKRAAPGPYDLAGSAHWANKTDLGITLHSPVAGGSELHVWKARFRRWGKRGEVAALDFNELTGRYSTPVKTLMDEPVPTDLPWTDA